MKIAMIGQKGIPAASGGVEKHVEEMAIRLVQQGHEVTVYCRNTYITENQKEYRGVKLVTIGTIPSKSLDAIIYTFKATMHSLFKRYDVYHYHALGPASLSFIPKIFRKKVVVTVHGLDWEREKWDKFATCYLKFGEFITGHFADKIVSVSKNLTGYFMDKYKRTKEDVVFIPNGVNIENSLIPSEIKKLGLDQDGYILFLARLVPEKGAHYLIEAFNMLSTDKKLVIAGGTSFSDDYVENLNKLAENNKNIIFTGNVQGELLTELYSNCTLYVLPSDIEGMPLTLLEALSYGKKVLVSDIIENLSVIEDIDNCYSFRKSDVTNLCEKIKSILTDSREHNSEEIIKIIEEQYSWKNVVEKYLYELEMVVN
jgi:glycosyltransferase involved in cell wall biosynthesis